jgi:hypothetical protein
LTVLAGLEAGFGSEKEVKIETCEVEDIPVYNNRRIAAECPTVFDSHYITA